MAGLSSAADFIVPLNMNGLSGRMLHMPGPKQTSGEVLFVYGQHSSLERWFGLMQFVSGYASVTAPDLPGFGGMESFYKIGKRPTIDNFADYLAAFIKMRYRHKKVMIIGMSMGFVIATRMLQRYPELKSHVSILVSLVGITHRDDFRFSRKLYYTIRLACALLSVRPIAFIYRSLCLNSPVLRTFYHHTVNAKHKFAAARNQAEHERFMDAEVWLWQHNDVRTQAVTLTEMLTLDNCRIPVALPLLHVATDIDQYFYEERVEQHLKVIFEAVNVIRSELPHHAPSIIADSQEAAPLIPPQLREVLAGL